MEHRFRFFGQPQAGDDHLWHVVGEEFFHLKKVLRLKEGDWVELCDGNGRWGSGQILELTREEARVRLSEFRTEEEKTPRLVLALGALQPATMADLIPMLVEVGISEVHVFAQQGTARSANSDKLRERWIRIAANSLKQCKRVHLPSFHSWPSLKDFVEKSGKCADGVLILNPDGESSILDVGLHKTSVLTVVLGSEKGLLESDQSSLQGVACQSVSLGTAVLRSFTAAILAVGILTLKRDLG